MQLRFWLVTGILAVVLGTTLPQETVCRAPDGKNGIPGAPGLNGRPGQKGDTGEPGKPARRTGIRGPKGDEASRQFPPHRGNTVVFDNIITNQEDSYSAQTGEFTCRIPGIYYFAYQVISSGDLCLSITKNKESVVSFCEDNIRNILQVNSGSCVLSLAIGDKVSVITSSLQNMIYSGSEADSVFSGFMLFPQMG
ncbi:complement C1q subcomponent subunit A isoform X2 [Rhea pennata]|uniref:complement C1q subcomponent subunit A isoform X2 n=1 Tax=Rhea pennata TaxID=8795 RepID=UPI002E25BAB1